MLSRLDVVGQVLTCTACELHAQCTAPVAFRGPTPTRVAVVGEAPGEMEDQQGEPFVGPAGQLLTQLLIEIGLTDVALVNSVSCFPHGTPTWDHVRACAVNKQVQLDLIDPEFVLLVGRVALKATRPDLDIKRGRGRPFLDHGRVHYATYHPAAALRRDSYLQSMRDDLVGFKRLLTTAWYQGIPDECAACAIEAVWWEDSGLGWCELHLPDGEALLYRTRAATLKRELDEARQGSSQDRIKTVQQAHRDQVVAARVARQQAIALVDTNADEEWKAEALGALKWCADSYALLTADDVWTRLSMVGTARTHEPAALGPIFLRGAKNNWIEKTAATRPTQYTQRHRDLTVWRSRLHQGAV